MIVRIPALSLVVLVGASGSGKSSFARRHFRATEILSSDACRGWVRDDENDQSATADAFDVLHYIAAKRLAAGKLTVVDATNVRAEDRKHLVALAREHHVLPVALVFDLPESVCHDRNAQRADRAFGPHVVRQQTQAMHRSLRGLAKEGFRNVTVLRSVADVDAVEIARERLWNDKRDEHGPFDIIGDVHGCYDELCALLRELGYTLGGTRDAPQVSAPDGRRAIFLGDLVDRGPDSPGVLRLAMRMVADGTALCVPGNHDVKLMRKLNGRDVQITHGLAETLQQLEKETDAFRRDVATFVDGLVSHYVLDDGRLVVAHAGMKESMQGRGSGAVRQFALYGESTGEIDEYGLPVRYEWARDYRGGASVVYGHTPVPEAEWINRTICIDTGCVFGGKLTALRWPERELVSVPALKTWYEPIRPLAAAAPPARDALLLDIADVAGKRVIATRLAHTVTVREENAGAALEVMSRFAIDPRWLVYLPPTMAPPAAASDGDALERPLEAFAYYRNEGVGDVVCQEKHMGSRAVIVLCRDESAARQRFGIAGDGRGVIHTRSGRRFFDDGAIERALLDRIDAALDASGLWDELGTNWIVLDTELMPWSAKAQELLRQQYAPTGAAGNAALTTAQEWLARAMRRVPDATALHDAAASKRDALARYVDAYRRYCWRVDGIDDYKIAPFHILAYEGAVGLVRDHRWQMDTLARLCAADPKLLHATRHRYVDLADDDSLDAATAWWRALTDAGGEGMVVKPVAAVVRGTRGVVQPAIKCRGREYLRIIYGPEYLLPRNLERLRSRGLGAKRSLAAREFALGVEALHRFVEREPLYRVHECVFGVLALESEPVDARL
ncbi:polynucleotide kinase-phosphatase [Tahibacter soli]|uniref:Polynucleotide kinase-phosphatase n=1 Tax=Tahibacter soli TaxID=2983605 RepID=A0A9X3YMD2_9GAMM|nr:polynucleotide kinase-phosphatase [Tahibacter soli]MDC8013373.1 polynucleotide kinase-phosphatase [Tahibacter soli]